MRIYLVVPAKEGDRIIGRSLVAPLGLITLAAYTPEGVDLRLIDENLESIDFEDKPDLVGITAMTATVRRAYRIADEYRSRGVKVVMGGIHVSLLPEEALEHADAVVIGEAESMWPKVVADADAGRLEPVYRVEERDDFRKPLPPRRDLINRKNYWMANVMQTSRGCPHDCSFCSVTTFNGRRVRERDLDSVLAEVESIPVHPRLRRRFIPFVDDNIGANRKRAKKLFEALKPLKTIWGSQACINFGEDEELVALAAESGCRMLFIGIETISPSSLEEIGKRQNKVERYADSLSNLRKHGIHVTGSFIFGFDSDQESVFSETLDFAVRNKIPLAQFSNLTPLPGTRLYDEMLAVDRVKAGFWLRDPQDNREVFKPKNMSELELCERTRRVQSGFYRLGNIVKRFSFGRNSHNMLLYNLVYNRVAVSRKSLLEVPSPAQSLV